MMKLAEAISATQRMLLPGRWVALRKREMKYFKLRIDENLELPGSCSGPDSLTSQTAARPLTLSADGGEGAISSSLRCSGCKDTAPARSCRPLASLEYLPTSAVSPFPASRLRGEMGLSDLNVQAI